MSDNSVNQIPPWVEIQGDIRLTPFYDPLACVATMEKHAAEVAAAIESLPTRGPVSKYFVKAPVRCRVDGGGMLARPRRGRGLRRWTTQSGDEFRGKITLTIDRDVYKGIACHLDSPGFKVRSVFCERHPYRACALN